MRDEGKPIRSILRKDVRKQRRNQSRVVETVKMLEVPTIMKKIEDYQANESSSQVTNDARDRLKGIRKCQSIEASPGF
jgi:hypothetical protein